MALDPNAHAPRKPQKRDTVLVCSGSGPATRIPGRQQYDRCELVDREDMDEVLREIEREMGCASWPNC